MTASRIVLDGIVPVLTQTPPTTERDSTTATRFFIFEAATAARCPEGPEPMTIRSYLAALIRVSPAFFAGSKYINKFQNGAFGTASRFPGEHTSIEIVSIHRGSHQRKRDFFS